MKRWGLFGLLAVGIGGLAITTCDSSKRMRYKMIVEVETPQGLRTGLAVRELIYRPGGGWFPLAEGRASVRVIGEAVAVDISPGRTLFALLTSSTGNVDHAGRDIWFMFRELDSNFWSDANIELWPNQPKTRSPQIHDPVPLLVTFRDNFDPTSIEEVGPDNLAAQFGPKVRLKRIWIEKSNADVTDTIKQRLGWLQTVGRERATLIPDPPRLLKDSSPIQRVGPSAFRIEPYKQRKWDWAEHVASR